MKPIVVSGVTPVQYQAFIAKLRLEKQALVETNPNGGKLSYQGTVIAWTYLNNTVTATPISKPFLLTEAHLDEWINENLVPPVVKPVAPAPTANVKAFAPNPTPAKV
jgi:hypothetical protein